jgi:hypothetical protein
MLIQACALEFFSIPGVAELNCLVGRLNIIEAGTARIFLRALVKYNEWIFLPGFSRINRELDIMF